MIKQVIRLIRPGLFLPCFEVEKHRADAVLIRPRFLSICAADQRYFQGNRPPEVLAQKLPIALFHEAVGEVLHDPSGELKKGTHCVLLPGGLDSLETNSNYKKGAFFRSSNADGFCQELMYMDRMEIIPVPSEPVWPYVFTELISVCVQGIRRLVKATNFTPETSFGIWGDGAMAFMMALTISELYPQCSITVFGKHDDKLTIFSFVDKRINIGGMPSKVAVDIAVECVGGDVSQKAIAQAIEKVIPTGIILLMGVSENSPNIPTRMILEKGLSLIGTSRSTRSDFEKAIEIIGRPNVQNTLIKIVSLKCEVSSAHGLIDIFRQEKSEPYKAILHINI